MKRILTLLLTVALAFSLTACLNTRGDKVEIVVNVLDELPTEVTTITFWHIYGQDKSELLDSMIAEFELLYPNIKVDSESQGNYSDLLAKTKKALGSAGGAKPDIVVGYPDHFAEYMDLGGIIPLDKYIEHATWGVDIDDYQASYVAENRQYADGMYSMPYSKSTEMMVYNKTKLDALGITFEENQVVTWEELEAMASTVVGDGANQCDFVINYDSTANLFINSSRQWGAGYTNSDGDVLVDNQVTRDMLAYYEGLFEAKVLALPVEWDQLYGSANFLLGDVCMTVGSTAGISYNDPANPKNTVYADFEIGLLPIPQFEGKTQSAMQQGPNIAVMESGDDAERLASWLLIKFLTSTDNTAEWAIDTGYLPVTKSGYNSDIYQDFLSGTDLDYLVEAASANAAYVQMDYNNYDPAFAGIGKVSSAKVRAEADEILIAIYAKTKTIEEALQYMIDQLSW